MKKELLRFNENDVRDDVIIYAIVSSESDIRLCQILNNTLNINLALSEPLQIVKKNNPVFFTRYSFEGEEEMEKFVLIINRNDGNYFFSELKKIDFLLIVISDSLTDPIENNLQKIKSHSGISVLYKVNKSELKSFNRIPL